MATSAIARMIAWVALTALPLYPGANSETLREAAGQVTRSLDVQPELPGNAGQSETVRAQPRRQGGGRVFEGTPVEPPAEIWGALKWPAITIVIALVLALLGSWLAEARARMTPALAHIPATAGPRFQARAGPDQLLRQADDYAAAGRYSEAMHQILLAAMAMLGARLGSAAVDSLTSWELLRVASLPPVQRQALRSLLARVDLVWFGKRPAASDDYEAVRASFRSFASETA